MIRYLSSPGGDPRPLFSRITRTCSGALAVVLVLTAAARPSAAAAAEAPGAVASPPASSSPSVAAPTEAPPAASGQVTPPAPPSAPAATTAQPSPPPAPPASARLPAVPPPPQAQDDEELRALVDESAPPRSRLNAAAWIGSGVTVLLLGTAAFFGAQASEKNGDVNRLLGNFDEKTGVPSEYARVADEYEQAVRDGRHDDRMAKGFAIAASVAAAASVVLFVVDALRAPADPAQPERPLGLGPRARTVGGSSAGNLGLSWVF